MGWSIAAIVVSVLFLGGCVTAAGGGRPRRPSGPGARLTAAWAVSDEAVTGLGSTPRTELATGLGTGPRTEPDVVETTRNAAATAGCCFLAADRRADIEIVTAPAAPHAVVIRREFHGAIAEWRYGNPVESGEPTHPAQSPAPTAADAASTVRRFPGHVRVVDAKRILPSAAQR